MSTGNRRNPYERKCSKCDVKMSGPYEWSDHKRVWFEWTCPVCGFVCQRFRWEMPGEQQRDPGVRTLEEYRADRSYKPK